ncbi:MAG: hypothetical protein AB1898_13595 [Acidobacteriota bacterium]
MKCLIGLLSTLILFAPMASAQLSRADNLDTLLQGLLNKQRSQRMGQPAPGNPYLGQLSVNPYATNSIGNKYSIYGSPYSATSINNAYSVWGSRYSFQSATNPYTYSAPKLYDSEGNYRGRLSANRYDPDSISNPYGRFGSKYSPDSIFNPHGAGSRYQLDSPWNPYGEGLSVFGDDGE